MASHKFRGSGLYDKNGKEIYEGDFVQLFSWDIKHKIEFLNGVFGYKIPDWGFVALASNTHLKWENNKSDYIEVVGNILECRKSAQVR